MTDASRANSRWQGQVHALMREGAGYEDIAVKLGCPVEDVRREAQILREEGRLDEIYRTWRTKK